MALPLILFNTQPVDLVINDHSIRYLEIKSPQHPIPIKWGERYLPPGIVKEGKILDADTLEMILEECIDAWKIKRRKVRYLIPDPFVTIRKIPIPHDLQEDEIEGYLFLEIGESIHLPFEDPVFDFVLLPNEKDSREILLFAANREYVKSYADLFSEVKLQPEAADLSCLALYRLYHHLDMKSGNENLLIIQFDLDVVGMSIFENETPFFMRNHQLKVDPQQWEISIAPTGFQTFHYIGSPRDMHEQYADAIREIKLLNDFYQYTLNQGKKGLTKILLTGDHPLIHPFQREIEREFELPVVTFDSSKIDTEKNRPLPASHFLSLGLALKEV